MNKISQSIKVRKSKNEVITVDSQKYYLEFRTRFAQGLLVVKDTHQRHLFFIGGDCNRPKKHDSSLEFLTPSISRNPNCFTVSFQQNSKIWKSKRTVYVCSLDYIEVFHVLEGKGSIENVFYFRGHYKNETRGMACDADEIYSTAPNFQEKLFFHPGESFGISAGDEINMPVGAQALASPCDCMGMHDRRDSAYLSVGLAAFAGGYTWDSFRWNPPVSTAVSPAPGDNALAGGFAAVYNGKQLVNGEWETPRLVLTFAGSRDDVLRRYLNHCFQSGYLPSPSSRHIPRWWKAPIYCTWHDQNGLAAYKHGFQLKKIGTKSFDFCTQRLCERWIKLLEEHQCKPGIVILDATWARNLNCGEPDPAKWNNMRAWIEKCHARGIRVFVWCVAWAIDGLPPDECITQSGKPIACDITNPKYLKRFREMIRRWFSDESDCLNADGVKLDGQLNIPLGKDLHNHAKVWGLELQRRYMQELHHTAHKYKSDVCISAFSLNPYLAEFTDMVRLGDMYTHRPTTLETMRHRSELFSIAQPHAVVDTDGHFRFQMFDNYISEFETQSELGTPTLYNAEWVFRHHFFQPTKLDKLRRSDYRIISKTLSKR